MMIAVESNEVVTEFSGDDLKRIWKISCGENDVMIMEKMVREEMRE